MYLINATVVTENSILENMFIHISNGKIAKIAKTSTFKKSINKEEVIDCKNKIIYPGFIDVHTHGNNGADFMDANAKSFDVIAHDALKEGVTGFLFTTVSASISKTEDSLKAFNNWENKPNQATAIGIHLEGPFINKCRKGAHDVKFLIKPDIMLVKKWQKLVNGKIKLLTYAIENANESFTKEVIKLKIIPSVGHSEATYDQVNSHIKCGLNHATHMYNAMPGIDHKHPGMINAILESPKVLAELITDGVHLSSNIINMTYKIKKEDALTIITDSMCAKNLKDGVYKLGSMDVVKKGMRASLKQNDNVIAGSVATFNHCVKYLQKTLNLDLVTLQKLTSLNMAKQLKIDSHTGSIALGKDADLIIVDKNWKIFHTIVKGNWN